MTDAGLVFSDTVKVNNPVVVGDSLYVNPLDFEKDKWILEGSLKAELSRQLWDTQRYFEVFNEIFDVTLKDAVTLWHEVNDLKVYVENSNKSEFELNASPIRNQN